jgi:hypothetical protein
LAETVGWLGGLTLGGISQLLRRLGIRYKRGRIRKSSPDPDYQAKRRYVQERLHEARSEPSVELLYLDECGYERQPTIDRDYEATGSRQPTVPSGTPLQQQMRIVATLNALDGSVCACRTRRINRSVLVDLYETVADRYAEAERIYVVQDNWPTHFHADVIGQLEPQVWPFEMTVPDNWPAVPETPTVEDPLPIQVVGLPTYAPWLNPIEKLWRWLKQEVIHLHRQAGDFAALHERVDAFLDRFTDGSERLLRYVGLLQG